MTVEMLKGKIHRATVVQAELDYVGSITVDEDLLEAAGIMEYEKVQIVDVNNGSRFETYTICKGIKAEEVLTKMREIIEAEPLAKIDYVSMVDALDMQPIESVEKDVLVAMAVYIGKTRLIDNFSYEV